MKIAAKEANELKILVLTLCQQSSFYLDCENL